MLVPRIWMECERLHELNVVILESRSRTLLSHLLYKANVKGFLYLYILHYF